MMISPLENFAERLLQLDRIATHRFLPPGDSSPLPNFPHYVDVSSNDYMGLAAISYNEVKERLECLRPEHFSSSASRLLSQKQIHHVNLESELERLYNKSVLLFNSGYHANTGCVSALNIPGTLFLTDKLIHASVIDGLKLSGGEFYRWNHNDINHLKKLIAKYGNGKERIVIIAEAIYSMDGDETPLEDLISIRRANPNVILYLDEAHSFGVRGRKGLGLAEESEVLDEVDILIGTFGKACASSGAFVATHPVLKDWFINSARSFIFSTALPPASAIWTLEMVKKLTGMETERARLAEISKDFRNFISAITNKKNPSSSQIVPLILGDAAKVVKLGCELREAGIIALPVRRPTVPPGGERIRFSLNAALANADIDYVKKQLSRFIE